MDSMVKCVRALAQKSHSLTSETDDLMNTMWQVSVPTIEVGSSNRDNGLAS